MNAKATAYHSSCFLFSLHTNPFNATHALLGKRLLHYSTDLFVFPTVCLGFVDGSCPVRTHFSAPSAGAAGGFAQRHVKKRGRRYLREKTTCFHSPPLLAYVELGFKPETFKSRLPSASPSGHCLPEGLCDSGLLEKCLRPGKKKKKVLTFRTAEKFKQV